MIVQPSIDIAPDRIDILVTMRGDVISRLANNHDPKKIISFFSYACLLDCDIDKHHCTIWVSNEFILTQIKKFFATDLSTIIKEILDPKATLTFEIFPPLQKKNHPLALNITKFLSWTSKPSSHPKKKQSLPELLAQPVLPVSTSSPTTIDSMSLRPEYDFSRLICGAHNEFAVNAAKAVAESPGTLYSPLFVYGGVWLGKTHILHAVGRDIARHDPKKRILCLPATSLVDLIVHGIRKNKLTAIKAQLCQADVLLIDDIQFLANKEKTQEVFLDIFNDYSAKDKQVVLTSDKAPKDLKNIESRLTSRFGKGLVVDVQLPDYETRLAILTQKCLRKGEVIDFDLLTIVAHHVASNVRELEGALNTLLTRKKLTWQDITEQTIVETLATLGYTGPRDDIAKRDMSIMTQRSQLSFAKLVDFVVMYYNLTLEDLKGPKRAKEITTARQLLMYCAKEYYHRTFEKIADWFGGKHHGTVIYAHNNIAKRLKKDSALAHDFHIFIEKLKG